MKLNRIISVILLFVYSVAALVGVGYFHCGCTQSQGWIVLAIRNTCPPCSRATEDCCPHSDQHHDEENGVQNNGCQNNDCCSVEYQYLKVDQLSVTHSHDVQAKALTLLFSHCLSVDGYITDIRECYATIKNHSPPGLLKIPLIYIYAQLRL